MRLRSGSLLKIVRAVPSAAKGELAGRATFRLRRGWWRRPAWNPKRRTRWKTRSDQGQRGRICHPGRQSAAEPREEEDRVARRERRQKRERHREDRAADRHRLAPVPVPPGRPTTGPNMPAQASTQPRSGQAWSGRSRNASRYLAGRRSPPRDSGSRLPRPGSASEHPPRAPRRGGGRLICRRDVHGFHDLVTRRAPEMHSRAAVGSHRWGARKRWPTRTRAGGFHHYRPGSVHTDTVRRGDTTRRWRAPMRVSCSHRCRNGRQCRDS